MSQGQTRKGWHMLDQQKSKFYLVDILSQSTDGEKTKVRFHEEVYQILTSELLPYQADKPTKLSELAYPNKAELVEWMSQNGADEKWIKLNSRVVIDFNINTQNQRIEHIKYLLGRFLISYRKKQYLVVANEPIKQCNQHTIHQTLIKTLPEIVYLWPYAISLTTLNFIYRILFTQLPIKFKIYIKESEIIRMSIIPYNCQSKDLMGEMSDSGFQILALKSPIFAVIGGSPREMRKYYKVPDKVPVAKTQYNINNLVDSLLQIGCKASEINSLIGVFVIILTINQLQFQKSKKQKRTYFRLRQDSQTKDTLTYWLGKQLVDMIEQDLNRKKDTDNELKDIKIKQYVLIKLIWQEAIRSAANLINSKMFNFNAPYTQEVRQFIFIEFPAVGSSFQQQLHNQKLIQVNKHIEKVALRIKKPGQGQTLNDQKIESMIKQEYGYDINKEILNELEKRKHWQNELSNGDFMTEFKRHKLKVSEYQEQQNIKKSNLNDLYQEITSLYDNNDRIFTNFIIRSEMNNNLPRKELLQNIQQSIQEKRRQDQQNQNPVEENQDWLEVLLSRFDERYRYTKMVKGFYKKKQSTFDGLQNYFKKHKKQGKIREIDQKLIVFLSYQKYRQLQDERAIHDIKSDKIKKQLKRYRYRRQFLRCVHKSCMRIRFIKQLIKKIKPSIKTFCDEIKVRAGIDKMQNTANKAILQSQRSVWHDLKKRAAIHSMQKVGKSFECNSQQNLQRQALEKLKAIRKNKRKRESMEVLSKLINNIKKDYFDDFINNEKQRYEKPRQTERLAEMCQKLNAALLRPSFNKLKEDPNHQNSNTLNTQPNQQNQNNKSKKPDSELKNKSDSMDPNGKQQRLQQPNTQNNTLNQQPQKNSQIQKTNNLPNSQNQNYNNESKPQQTSQSQNNSQNNHQNISQSQSSNLNQPQQNTQNPNNSIPQANSTNQYPSQQNTQNNYPAQNQYNNPQQNGPTQNPTHSQPTSQNQTNYTNYPQQANQNSNPPTTSQNPVNNNQNPPQTNVQNPNQKTTQPLPNLQNSNKLTGPQQNSQSLNQNTVQPQPTSQNQNTRQNNPQQNRQNPNNTQNINQPLQTSQNPTQQPSNQVASPTSYPIIQINQPLQSSARQPTNQVQNQSNSNPPNLVSNKNGKEPEPIKEQNYQSAGDQTSRQSNAPSAIGFEKSETSRPITKQELYSLKDKPKFSFQIWQKQAKGFNRKKPTQVQKQQICKLLFNKPDVARPANKQTTQELNVDILIKQKVVVNPFFPYLMDHITANSQEQMQKIMSHQSEQLKQPLLKKYPLKEYAKAPTNTFNNILKIGKDKNTTRSVVSMINDILKPIRQSYSKSQKVSNVFDNEPSLVTDYTWSHNIVKDEMFLQFIKQIMMNQKQQSLKELISALQIITRYYYPSPQFMYSFLHYLKSLQSKNIQKLNDCFINILLYAQAFERYKGNSVTVLKQEVPPKQKESYNKLLMRSTQIGEQQMEGLCIITMRLFNQQRFQFRVRNQSLSLFKRKVLKAIHLLHYEDYFGVYYCKTRGSNMVLIPDSLKAIDFIIKNPQNQNDHLLYIKMNRYFPFSLKQINKTKMFYLNSLVEQKYLPWKQQCYQGVVALSMLFDEFEEYRITNFVILTGQQSKNNVNISKIEAKYNELSQQKGKKVNQYEYLKLVKQNDFLGAKCYRIKEQLLSPVNVVTKVLTKPLELCFYQGNIFKASINLKRIKSYYFDKNEITMQIEMSEIQNQSQLRQLTLRGVDKAYEFYLDLSFYIEYLSDK